MRFKLAGDYNVSVDEFWTEVFFVPSFVDALHREGLKYSRYEIVEETVGSDCARTRTMLAYPTIEVPRALKRILGADLHYREVANFDPDRRVWRTETSLPRLGQKVTVKTDMYFTDTSPGHSVRTVEFEVRVKIFGVGRILEGFIKRTLTDVYEQARVFTNTWTDNELRGKDTP